MNIYDIFKQLNIEFKEKEHEPIFTIEQAQNIKNINGTGCKNLFLTNRKKNYYLVLLEETKRANIKDIAKLVNESHLSFASEIELNNILKLKPGSVTPLGIINDKDNIVTLIIDNELKGKVYYFAIDKSSSDYKRLKKKGSILKIGSYKYRLKFVNSDKIISAHADDWVINAFAENEKYIKGLYDFDYVFLQHGITKDDLSSWLHKTNRDISLFITAARKEYHSIVNGTYGYTEKEVVLSGFPRYDKLISEPKKKLVFLPTWRKDIAEKTISGSSERPYSESFKESNYYEFYNRMINDESLIRTMKEYGFEGEFYNHPAFFSQANDFKGNDTIKVVNDKANYQNIFRENALLITDYSSVAFDFSYMKKPVVYCQFDRDSFFKRHTYKKGYFDYETN